MKKILLINPYETEQSGFTNPPIGLLYLAGTLLKHGFDVRVVDGCLEGKAAVRNAIEEFHPQLVGISSLTPGRKKAIAIADMVKQFDSRIAVVFGGAHPTIMHQQIMENYPSIDCIVLGEGEESFLELAQDKEPAQINGIVCRDKGKIVKTPPRENIPNLDDIPFPAWHLVDLQKYPAIDKGIYRGINLEEVPRISVIFSRGCTGHCDFCSTWWIWKGWRHRSTKNMVDEIELLYQDHGVRHFCFADDAMTVNRQATIELCDEIIRRKLDIVFHATTRTDCVDEIMLKKMKEAGCYKIAFGIETGSPILLEKMGKNNDVETSVRAIKLAKDAGVFVTALMIIGNVGETRETVRETVNFLRRTQPDEIGCVGGLWILPGTKLFRDCKKKGFIDDSFWLSDEPYKIYTMEYSLDQLEKMRNRVVGYQNVIIRTYKMLKGMMK
jgi:anaerobic magnesium-protoporphyrin IX monomethyl ester cyclase